jgi:membrane associated rhomboid family serine protease
VLYGSHPTFLTLFTHQFLHADFGHLLGNTLFLWLFDSLIEDAIRPWGLAALYLGGGVAAGLANIGMSRALGSSTDIPEARQTLQSLDQRGGPG